METNNCRYYTLRLNPDNAEHIELIDVLDDLNLEVHKSKNRFMINAIKYYVDSIRDGSLTYTSAKERMEMEDRYPTMDYLDKKIDACKTEMREEFYQDIIHTLETTLLNVSIKNNVNEVGTVLSCVKQESEETGNTDTLSDRLNRYDDAMQ